MKTTVEDGMIVAGKPPLLNYIKGLVHVIVILAFFSCADGPSTKQSSKAEKFSGISLVGPPHKIDSTWTTHVNAINANWVAIIPYAFCDKQTGKINYGDQVTPYQWWGERPQGVRETVIHAKNANLKVMVKPHLWIPGSWPGSFNLNTESDWKQWEDNYENYILQLAAISDSLHVDLFCIGTELRYAATKRPHYFKALIHKVRTVFSGPLTFAANWDNYQAIPFWSELDYIGVDAYFPLSHEKTPTTKTLQAKWKPIKKSLKSISEKFNKPILFTEYGYRSIDQAAWRNWEVEENYDLPVNLEGQKNAYEALFETFWSEAWFAGGFSWKWYHNDHQSGGSKNTDYTPQNKPAERIMKYNHEKFGSH